MTNVEYFIYCHLSALVHDQKKNGIIRWIQNKNIFYIFIFCAYFLCLSVLWPCLLSSFGKMTRTQYPFGLVFWVQNTQFQKAELNSLRERKICILSICNGDNSRCINSMWVSKMFTDIVSSCSCTHNSYTNCGRQIKAPWRDGWAKWEGRNWHYHHCGDMLKSPGKARFSVLSLRLPKVPCRWCIEPMTIHTWNQKEIDIVAQLMKQYDKAIE